MPNLRFPDYKSTPGLVARHGRRRGRWAGLLAAALLALPAAAAELPSARDLQQDARTAAREHRPVLVLYAARDCPYCKLVEGLYLQPMLQQAAYADRLLFRVIRIDSREPLRDFAGRMTDQASFAAAQGVAFTPVIRFYGPDGRQLAPELRGYTGPDFYAGELEQAVAQALERLRPGRRAG